MENAEVYYVLFGGALLAAYMLIYFLRVKRTRQIDEYLKKLHEEAPTAADEKEPQLKGVTREDIEDGSKR